MSKNKKIIFLLAIIFSVVFVVFIFVLPKKDNLEVDFLDVGQGDSELIKTPYGQNILVDGGPDRTILKRLGGDLPFWDRKIDLMVLTHPHADHVTGLNEVLKRYKVEKILYTGVLHSDPNYLNWLRFVRDKKIPIFIVDHPQIVKLGNDCEMDIIYPDENFVNKEFENLNNSSMAFKLKFKHETFLLAGDLEKDIEHKLVLGKTDLAANVFKADHHGSDTSNTEEFLNAVRPQIAIIEVGKDNKYGQPSGRVLKRFERVGTQVFRTDENGTVRVESDGEEITVLN